LKNKYKILLGIEPKHPVVITTKVIPIGSNAPECEDGDGESVEFGENGDIETPNTCACQ
tara:strand:+ start:326 stop:502 length:177 start_codon:yes stop_codon:yes gene_type:complete